MELIISILMALGLIHGEKASFSMDKLKTTKEYQKVYDKVGSDVDVDPNAWARAINLQR